MPQSLSLDLALAPEAYQSMQAVNAALDTSTLGRRLLELVDLRVSQINGCAYCVDMHARNLLAHGEDPQRLNSLVTWQETDFFDARERAALAWAETLTDIMRAHPAQGELEALRTHFNDNEIVELTFAIAQINCWNRVSVGLHRAVRRGSLRAAA